MALPRFIVLRSPAAKAYLSFKKENDLYSGYAEFSEPLVVSSDAKFEVESAKGGLVHIRNCATNNYLERTEDDSISGKPDEQYWITVTAEKKEEDQSKESCTLFKPMEEDAVNKTYRFVHVQSGCYLCLRLNPSSDVSAGVLANSTKVDSDGNDIFRVIDWDWLVILPKFVAFKGNNDKYLRLIEIEVTPMEIFYTPNGIIRIKAINSKKYWRRSPNWISVDSDDTVGNDKDTLFRPFKVDSKTIALLNLGNNTFCKRLKTEGKTSYLNAGIPSATKETYLKVEEPVLSRKIENITYLTENSRIYNKKVEIVARSTAINHSKESNTQEQKPPSNSEFRSSRTVNIEITASAESVFEWGETTTTRTVLEVTHKVTVPPMTKVTMYMVMTRSKCDVPFTYTQKDALYNGEVVTTVVKGNTYKGSNYYNTDFNVKEEPLTS
ncbi:uncharacterized protein LOC120115198 [Hibiscus syriacus]|uniref:uncharacterized protein LOC120115198 n=1 Tax=Hibiscus syriacus TaxID=106335 RepID=UPI001921990F|nr:uncharacterized protein LOC120115198 [Hibiscus syriacus]